MRGFGRVLLVFLLVVLPVLSSFADHRIFSAITNGNAAEVARMLKDADSLDFGRDFRGCTPLMMAVERNNIEIVKLLVEAGADLSENFRDSGFPLIFAAIRNSDADMVDYLLQQRCPINTPTPTGNTALHAAVIRQNSRIVARLIIAGADTNSREYLKGYTPLHYAAEESVRMELFNFQKKSAEPDQRFNIAKRLINNRANPRAVAFDGHTPYSLAVERSKTRRLGSDQSSARLVDLLSQMRANIPQASEFPLQILPLIQSQDYEAVKKFLHQHPDGAKTWFKRGAFGETKYQPIGAVAYSAHQGNLPMVKLLIDKGADPVQRASREYDLQTTIHFAAINDHNEVVEYLLQKGVSPNIGDIRGRTPLHYAARNGNFSLVRMLRQHQASPHKPGYHGVTPIDWSARNPLIFFYLKSWMWQTSNSDPFASPSFKLFDFFELRGLITTMLGLLWPLLLPLTLFFVGWHLSGFSLVKRPLTKLTKAIHSRISLVPAELSQKEIFFIMIPVLVALLMLMILLPLTIIGMMATGGHPPFIIFPLAINGVCAIVIFPMCILLLLIGLVVLRKEFARLKFLWLISFGILLPLETLSALILIYLR